MAITDNKLYKYHVSNIHSIEIALSHSARAARNAISEKNNPAIKSFTSLNALLLGAWAENRLLKLLYENNGFSVNERKSVLSEKTQLNKWVKVIEVAFRKHYRIPKATLNSTTLPFTASAQYKILNEIIGQDLKSVIEIRNKLAHGQWIYPFNSDGDEIQCQKYKELKNENILSLQFKKSLLTGLTDIIHDLVVSKETFERDFNKNYQQITCTRNNLKNRDYTDYAEQLFLKKQHGVTLRKQNQTNDT